MLVHHKKVPAPKVQDYEYKCVLCSNAYFTKRRLGCHYVKKHGRDSFLKYYAPVYKQVREKSAPKSPERPLTRQPENTLEVCTSGTTATEENKTILVYRCPSCPYVNASYHGTLTHCQMKHPDVIARADELKTDEILGSNMVGCSFGKASNERGYMCKMCPLIYPSLKKLRIHSERDHSLSGATEHSAETKKQPAHDSEGSPLKALKSKETPAASATETSFSDKSSAPETCQSNSLSTQNKERLYKCHICTYTGFFRRYLQVHYKNTHKLDPLTTRRLLQKYNKRQKADTRLEAEPEESGPLECKKCPALMFDSPELLVDHYSTFHSSDGILDFTVISQGIRKGSTGLYRCIHCLKQMNGVRKLWYHLDCHRESARKGSLAVNSTASPEAKSIKFCGKDDLLMLDTVDDLAQFNVTPAETFTFPLSPLASPSKPADVEQLQLESEGEKHTCKQCRRSFMSLKGLRSHERSHAATAALKKMNNLPTSVLKHNINKYVVYKPGTLRPFLCSICSYRTTVMGLWRSHFMKSHQDVIVDPAETDDQDEESDQRASGEPVNLSEELNYWPELDEDPEISEKSYLEPPDVQRQLNHYSLMAQADASSKTNVQETKLPNSHLLYCDFCNFNTEHLSSIRRHYLNRHGKKILRCKDCDFVTGLKKTLEMHMETGHSTCQSEPTHQKDLRCPLCLYQTKNKNNMIDHIVLHREERVVPIEVRRSKLSRYLQGIVFRCHKCTFTSGSADNLHLHMKRHNDVKPYKCRLCYFDCPQLSDLEAHLSDKHQVVRNHELVGQVSLDELRTRVGGMPEEEKEEASSNLEHHNGDSEGVETEEFVTDCDEVPHEMRAKDRAENDSVEGMTQQTKEADQKQGQDDKNEEGLAKSSQEQVELLPVQPRLGDGEHSSVALTQHKEEAALRHCQLLDEDGSIHKMHEEADQDRTVKTEAEDEIQSEMILLDEKGSIPLAHNPNTQVQMEANNSQAQESFTAERHLLTLSPKCAPLKMSHKESSGVSFTNCKQELEHRLNISEEVREAYGEMPVLENEYLKDEMQPLGCCKEEEQSDQDKDETITEDEENRTNQKHEEGNGMEEVGHPRVPKGALTVTDGAAEVLRPATIQDKPFTCELCGRTLMNGSELQRHIMRHGM